MDHNSSWMVLTWNTTHGAVLETLLFKVLISAMEEVTECVFLALADDSRLGGI